MFMCTTRRQKLLRFNVIRSASLTGNTAPRRTYSIRPQTSTACIRLRPCLPITSIGPVTTCLSRQSRWQDVQKKIERRAYSHSPLPMSHRAFIALGSNMGDRVDMIEKACKMMETTGEVKILQTSSLYETKAMYVLDQDNFVNGACEVSYTLAASKTRTLMWIDSNFVTSTAAARLSPVGRKPYGPCQGH